MTKLSQSDLVSVLEASMDDAYIGPLKTEDNGSGFDVYQAIAAQLERASDSVETTTQAMYLLEHSDQAALPASGGVKASGTIIIRRAAPTDGDIVFPIGELLYIVLSGPDGNSIIEAELEVTTETTISDGDSGPVSLPVQATRVGYHANLPASEVSCGRFVIFRHRTTKTMEDMSTSVTNKVTQSGDGDTFDDGVVGAWLRFTSGPNIGTGPRYIESFDGESEVIVDGPALVAGSSNNDGEVVGLEDLGFTAEIDGMIMGGLSPMLDMIGAERGMGRNPGEIDSEYRERLKYLPDTICPNAIYRAASRILTPLSIPFLFVESRSKDYFSGGAWDDMPYDDPAVYNSITGRHHFYQGDGFEYRGFYIIIERQWYGDFGFPFDTKYPGGQHQSAAWDFGFYDGYPAGFWNDLRRVVSEIEKTRAAGVPWLLILVDSL